MTDRPCVVPNDELLHRLETIERHLEKLLTRELQPESDWVDSREFCRLIGLRDTKALVSQMSKGIIHGAAAIRNIGTVKRPRYRFHRVKAVNQFLKSAEDVWKNIKSYDAA